MNNGRLIVVLGMHRSGSSAITHGLEVMGVRLGDTLLPPIEGVNPKGFWEDADINALNILMLQSLKKDWHHLTPIAPSDLSTLYKRGYLERCSELLCSKVNKEPGIFGFKDPRVAKLLPFWKTVFHQCQFDTDYILTVRHPLSVAKSLYARDGFDTTKSYLLWLGHVVSSLSETANEKRILVDYDRLIVSPDNELSRLANHLNLAVDPTKLEYFRTKFLDPSLRHTCFEASALTLDKCCPPLVRDIYAVEIALASDARSSDDPLLQRQISNWKDEFGGLESTLALADRLDQTVTEHGHQIGHLRQALEERNEQLKRLFRSKSWLITKPFRVISRALRDNATPVASGLRQLLASRSDNDELPHTTTHVINHPHSSTCQSTTSENTGTNNAISVILPIYGGIEMTRRCILAAMPGVLALENANIVAIDDASPDEGLQEMIEEIARRWPGKFIAIRNDKNIGFVRTVNRGLLMTPRRDVVLLNSDVIVPENWLHRLRSEAYSKPDIGTVTPFSNNATICSYPHFLRENPSPFGLKTEVVDAVFNGEKLPCIEAPTGVGFCMYIRRACLDDVGNLDEGKFGKGYGEENDLCQRALKKNWLNLISPNVYAYHEGGASFSSRKQALVDRAMQIIDEQHPNYRADIQSFIINDPLKAVRTTRYIQLLSTLEIPKVLHVSHDAGGGVAQHIAELGKHFSQHMVSILLRPHRGEDSISIQIGIESHADTLFFDIPSEYENLVTLLKAIGISAVHFHHTLGLHSQLLKIHRSLGVTHLLTVHDFYWLNANPTLTNCGGKFPGVYSDTQVDVMHLLPDGIPPQKWREQFQPLFKTAECIVFPSNSTREFFANAYSPNNSLISSHIEAARDVNISPGIFKKKDSYTIGVLGALGKEKGADLLEKLATQAKNNRPSIKFKLIGYAYRSLKSIETTGPYNTENLATLIQQHELDVIFFPAQWPETYSYTLSYAINSGLPIIAPGIGAFPERLSGRNNTIIFNYQRPTTELLDEITGFLDSLARGEPVQAPDSHRQKFTSDFYSSDYLRIVSQDIKVLKAKEANALRLDLSRNLTRPDASVMGWHETAFRILVQIYRNPSLRWAGYLIPSRIRRAARRFLSNDSIHNVALKQRWH